MPRYHFLKDKRGSDNEKIQDDCMERTSARTRPLSYKDIIVRRKTRENAVKLVSDERGGVHMALVSHNTEKDLHSLEYNGQLNEEFVPADAKPTSDNPQKINSLGKGDVYNSNNLERQIQDSDNVHRNSKIKLKSIIRINSISEPEIDHYSRNPHKDRLSTFVSDNGYVKQKFKDLVRREVTFERSRDKLLLDRKVVDLVRREVTFERSRDKLLLDRKVVDSENRQFHRKRKTDKHMAGDTVKVSNKRYARDMIQEDKFSDRRRDKSKGENYHKHYNGGSSAGKKHDSETKERDSAGAYDVESKLKRKQSLSIEHVKDKGRESPSHSPKAHRHTTKYRSKRGELYSHSAQNTSLMDSSDTDKKISGKGSSHYKKNPVSTSGLGGYSPRKRKTDAAARTPSPTRRSPEKKSAGWDLPLDGKQIIVSSSNLPSNASDQNLLSIIKEFPGGIPLTSSTVKPDGISHLTLSSQMHAVDSIQLTQATRPMRRLYVENLPILATEKDLMECINNLFLSARANYIRGTQPCISCIIHKEKNQALLEFLTPDDASVALSFNGKDFLGCNLKLRRPKDYTEVSTGLPEKSLAAIDPVSNSVEDSSHKIFIGGISKCMTSEMVFKIASVFGLVKAFNFQLIGERNEPCAFLEYIDHSVTSKACSGLNGLKLGGQVITAAFATPDLFLAENDEMPFYGIPEHAKPLLEKPTVVLKLLNVLDPEVFSSMSESELEEVVEDIKLECSRFGTVKSVNMVKPTNAYVTTEASQVNTINGSIDVCGSEVENTCSSTEQPKESVDELEEDELRRQETQNTVENNDPTLDENQSYGESVDSDVMIVSTVIDNRLCDETAAEVHQNEEILEPAVDENIFIKDPSFWESSVGCTLESTNQLSTSRIDFDSDVIYTNSIPLVKTNHLLLKKEPISEDGDLNTLTYVESVGPEEKEHEDVDKRDTSPDPVEAFEPGSVYVEFKRAEATCMAAHNLHGRLFDGRVVTAMYIDHDLYQTRFSAEKRSLY